MAELKMIMERIYTLEEKEFAASKEVEQMTER
jgi:hypothetical protein